MAQKLKYEYLLKMANDVEEKIVDTLSSDFDYQLRVSDGFIYKNEYHRVTKVETCMSADRGVRLHFVSLIHVPFEEAPKNIKDNITWNLQSGDSIYDF
jgi:hypothetical protein